MHSAPHLPPFWRTLALPCAVAIGLIAAVLGRAQVNITTDFKGTSAPGWTFGGLSGSTDPYLTATAGDTVGDGWLRLTGSQNNQATFALFDSQIFAVNAQIQIEMEYAFWNGVGIDNTQYGVNHTTPVNGGPPGGWGYNNPWSNPLYPISQPVAGDGITFFLVDGSVDTGSFSPGSYGGSLGYAQLDTDGNGSVDSPGMAGGYLGFGFDNWGNYAGETEGREGGVGTQLADGDLKGYANRLAVRGPESSDFEFIAASSPLEDLAGGGQMDDPLATTRPDQEGAGYRSFRLTLDANNQLLVEMKFGATGTYIEAFSADLSTYDRPDLFKIGFTASTGGAREIHEIRNVSVTMTPWQPDAFEWDNGAGSTDATNATNWVGDALPGTNADVRFGDIPTSGPQLVDVNVGAQLNSITFDSDLNYSLNGTGSLTMGDTLVAGLPSINVNDYNGAQGQHKINLPITLNEELRINNYSFSTLCLNGEITTNGNTLKVNGTGAVNFNAAITGSGDLIKNGEGITTIGNNNTAWTGDVTVNNGLLVVLANGALGTTAGTTTVNNGGSLAFRGEAAGLTYSTTESVTISGNGVFRGEDGFTGAIYNDGGNNSFAGGITLAANAGIGSRDGVLTLSGQITDGSGTYSLTKLGDGTVSLSNTSNNWNGATIIQGGALRITAENALAGGFTTNGYTGGNLQLAGGVLEIGTATTFARSVGTGSDQVRWTGDGGFSAHGGDRTVTLSGGTMTWGAGSFVGTDYALVLGSETANANLTFTNAIALGGLSREIRAINGTDAGEVDGTISGVISGTGGILKTGDGTLSLSGPNTYTGNTVVADGALRVTTGSLPGGYDTTNTGSNFGAIDLAGGVLELASNTTFTRRLGTGEEYIFWSGDGGFSASGGARTVSLVNSGGTANGTLTWNAGSFVPTGNALVLGSSSADNTLTLTNAIDLAGATRTVNVQNGTAATDAILSGILSNGTLNVVGAGRVNATAANTITGLTIEGAEFRLAGGAAGQLDSLTALTVQRGGIFSIDELAGRSNDRLSGTLAITLDGGTFNYLGDDGGDSSEATGGVTLAGGANTINTEKVDGNDSSQMTFASLTRNAGTGATVNFTNTAGGGTLGSTGDNPRTIFTAAPTLNDSIMGYATVNATATGGSFAGHGANGIVAVAGTNDAEGSWTTSINATNTADVTLTGTRTVNSLNLGSGIDVNIGGNALTVDSGGVLSTGATGSVISNGTLTAGTALDELIAHVYGAGGLNISAVIANNGDAIGLTKTGDGTLALSGATANTNTGKTTVNDGTLSLAKTDGVTSLAGDVDVGDGRGTDVLLLTSSEQIADTSTVTLTGSQYGGETVLRFNSTGGTTETFAELSVDGSAVIDFAGGDVCDPNFLFLDTLSFTANSVLYIRNWIDFTDYLLVKATEVPNLPAILGQIQFEGYGDLTSWQDYDADYVRITPVPEPSTYGAMLMGAGLAFFGYRRWRAAQRPAKNA